MAEETTRKGFTGEIDTVGNPIQEGDMVMGGPLGLDFSVIQWQRFPADDGGYVVGYHIPANCRVVADVKKK